MAGIQIRVRGNFTNQSYDTSLSAILLQIKDSDTKQAVSNTGKKLNVLSGERCAVLTATTKRRKLIGRDYTIKTRSAKAKGQAKQPIAAGKKSQNLQQGKG